ncbi:MAG: hypothetical protein IJ668_06780 [Selenomonadaceae bacterium]|nr:hypothetical protein [Selenomonadaceae bacterium]
MRKKFLLMWSALMISAAPIAGAQEVTVEGVGTDRDSATRDAVRIAVEQVSGAYINADTLVKDLAVEIDEIYKKSQGYVKSITVLSERQGPEGYRVRARVDVDTDPNGKLMNEIAMLYALNDPRIAVIVFQGDSGEGATQHDLTAETAMNSKLISMGFSHVVDTAMVIRRDDPQLLNAIYENQAPLNQMIDKDTAIDYLVLGRLNSYVSTMQVPDYNGGGMIATGMQGARANLTCRVIKYDTGTMIGTFQTEGTGLDGDSQRATNVAIKAASTAAAEELSKTFRRAGAVMTENLQFIIYVSDYDLLDQFRQELLHTDGVQNVHRREYRNGRAVLDVESTHKADTLIQLLQKRTSLRLIVVSESNSRVELSIS